MTKLRGLALSDSTVVELLQPFVVASWAGFDPDQAPAPLRGLVDPEEFGPQARGGPR